MTQKCTVKCQIARAAEKLAAEKLAADNNATDINTTDNDATDDLTISITALPHAIYFSEQENSSSPINAVPSSQRQ
ncbi:hypothetical protein Vi05172_g9002 [Venturia inaequalis]|nr:hypothetical protein Vi05172_g9002 [Venturia inaequalis]